MKTNKEISNYLIWIGWHFERAEQSIYLPQVDDQDDRLEALQVVTSATQVQAKVVKQQLATHKTNWQRHMAFEKIAEEKKWTKASYTRDRVLAVEAYENYANKRGFSEQHIAAVVKQIWEDK